MKAQDLTTWITDTEISQRFPYYTRSNADEVGPDPFSPLGWSLGWMKGCIPGVANGFVNFGVLRYEEYALTPPEVFGNWGGYFYNQLSLPRLMGCRMPGATPAAIDIAYFGDNPEIPPYVQHPDDDDEVQSAKLAETMGWAMSTDSFPEMDAGAALSRSLVAQRPNVSQMSDSDLVSHARSMGPHLLAVWEAYCEVCLGASLGPGAVQAICAALGRPDDAMKLLAGVGNIESAEASFAMWDLSRMIKRSPELMENFDRGVDGLLGRIESSFLPEVSKFINAWNQLISDFGHRGPNEWDMRAPSWKTNPVLTLSMLERLRFQSDDRSPYISRHKAVVERERLAAEYEVLLVDDVASLGTLRAGMSSAALFYSLRERGKSACIRVIHEAKLAFNELGRRMVERKMVAEALDIYLLLDGELDSFLENPLAFTKIIEDRGETFAYLHLVEPPYIIKLEDGVAPISSWPLRHQDGGITKAIAGEILQGAPGAPGIISGRARIILDPSHADDLQPGDIMVAPTTDPSWTPLFLSVAGVIVNVGAVASHAVIVSRELGVPCVVSVVNATKRITEGATVSIDGSSGVVTILSV